MKINKMILTGLKNASYLTIGSIITTIISTIGFILIARELRPGDYGTFVTVTTYISFFALITMSQMANDYVKLCRICQNTGSRWMLLKNFPYR